MGESAPTAVADVAAEDQPADVPADGDAIPADTEEAPAEEPAEIAPEEQAPQDAAAEEPSEDPAADGEEPAREKHIDLLAFCAQIGLVGVVVGEKWPLCVLP